MRKWSCVIYMVHAYCRTNPANFDEVGIGPKTPVPEGDFFRQPLREQVKLKRPLVSLSPFR
ncbi:hypothetical protein OKW40_005780 [Paraburkholderia sp. RAU6.4a]